jgi:hypothetical protein
VTGDLESATQLATLMEGYWGMGSTIASHAVTDRLGIGRPMQGEDKERGLLKGSLAMRIEGKLRELYDRTEALLLENRVQLYAVTHALEANKTLTGADIEAVIEFKQGPIVDGRPYGTAEFLEVAEHYHEKVLAAHTAHGEVAVPLPPLPRIFHDEALAALPVVAGANGNGHTPVDDGRSPWAGPDGAEPVSGNCTAVADDDSDESDPPPEEYPRRIL